MTYQFYHTFESGKQVGYEIILKQEDKNIMVDTICILQPLLEEQDENEFYIFREYMNQEIVDLCHEKFGPPDKA